MTMEKRVQAKDLDDFEVVAFVTDNWKGLRGPGESRWTMTSEVQALFPLVPPKVVLAKLRALVKRNLLDGCACGCRGDFIPVRQCDVLGCGARAYDATKVRWTYDTVEAETHETIVGLCHDHEDDARHGRPLEFEGLTS